MTGWPDSISHSTSARGVTGRAAPARARFARSVLACSIAGGLCAAPLEATAVDVDASAATPVSVAQSDATESLDTADVPDPPTAAPSMHLSTGGRGHFLDHGAPLIPGGTFALGRHDFADMATFEQPAVVGRMGLEISYISEGHFSSNWPWYWPVNVPLHYRDGYAVQLDEWSPRFAACRFGGALGPETYFDTTTSGFRTHYEDRHGIGLRAGLTGQCNLSATVAIEVHAARTFNVASYDATTLTFGLAYTPRDDAATVAAEDALADARGDYVNLVGGRALINSFRAGHDSGWAEWLTYGHRLTNLFAMDFSALNESMSSVMERRSLAAQLVVSRAFFERWLQIFAGIGPALAHTNHQVNGACNEVASVCDQTTPESYTQVNLLYTYGFRIFIGKRFSFVAKMGRVGSASGNTDTDMMTAGFGISLN